MFIGTTPVPAAQRGVGRWIFWQGEQQDWVQITKCDRDAAYAFAAHGRELHDERAALGYETEQPELTVGSDTDLDYTAPILTESTTSSDKDTRRIIVGVKEAARYLGYSKWRTFDTARSRRPIPGQFDQGRNVAWYADDLDAWYRARNRRKEDHDG
jgi:predicted DNA-binding transcriptional regulator AlpA